MNNPFETINARLSNIESLLLDIKHTPKQTTPDLDRWFSLDDLCAYLPGNPAKATIYGKVHGREIPHKKVGKRLMFLKSEIDQWLKEQGRKTVSEIAADVNQYLAKNKKG